jgi:ABC-type glycerol-3-phosphate transport system permease component
VQRFLEDPATVHEVAGAVARARRDGADHRHRRVPFTLLMACGVVTAAVPGIVAVALNRLIISGVTSGAVK